MHDENNIKFKLYEILGCQSGDNIMVMWHVTPCSLIDIYKNFSEELRKEFSETTVAVCLPNYTESHSKRQQSLYKFITHVCFNVSVDKIDPFKC
jgi:hypothetical protein